MTMGPPPLAGLKVIELAGLAPGPFAGMLLADAGASVLRIDRAVPGETHTTGKEPLPTADRLARRKASIAVDLKSSGGASLVKELVRHADILIDPFRPGVLEKRGLGPQVLLGINPRLIYSRLTGFRRDGMYSSMAGHDINYLAVSGLLDSLGRSGEKPYAPWNLLADFAGGGGTLFQGILLALVARQRTGRGQVVDVNMVDGSSYLASFLRFALKSPVGDQPRGMNILDGGCPWYDTYETQDGHFMAIGALEPQFFSALIQGLGLRHHGWEETRYDRLTWPDMKRAFEEAFRSNTRQHWETVFAGTDACCTPVLSYRELEHASQREGDQRPAATLSETPCLSVEDAQSSDSVVHRSGYHGQSLSPGQGGEDLLRHWLGWTKGREFGVHNGGLVNPKSKL